MTAFGAWLAGNRVARIALIAALFPLALAQLVSAAIVVLTAARLGWRNALVDAGAAVAILAGIALAAGAPNPAPLALLAALTLGFAVLLGGIVGRHGSLTLAVQCALLVGIGADFAFRLAVGDAEAFWRPVLTELIPRWLEQQGLPVANPAALPQLAVLMTGMLAASAVASALAALLIGIAIAGGAGGRGFGLMFRELRLGRVIGAIAIVAGVASVLGVAVAGDCLLVLTTGFALQGFAVAHWQVAARGWPSAVLLGVYGPMLLGPLVVSVLLLLMATVGFIDNVFGLRRRPADML